MQKSHVADRLISVAGLLAAAAIACNLQAVSPAVVAERTQPVVSTIELASTQTSEPSVAATPSNTVSPTLTATVGPPPVITVSASGGRLNVRRGPGPEFDSVGAFLDGQSSIATARNADATWVLINVPNTSKTLGWITLATKYTSTSGEAGGLPLLEVAAAAPAYIRNCTGREMLVNPIGAILQPRGNAPDNQQQFFPGEYNIVDMETETSILDITVFEGKTIDIRQDSSGKKSSC